MVSNTVPPPPPPGFYDLGMRERNALMDRAEAETARGHMGGPGDILAAAVAAEPGRREFLAEALREVDALTPACPPIAPQPSPTYRREEWLAGLVVPDAGDAEVPAWSRIGRRPPPPGRERLG